MDEGLTYGIGSIPIEQEILREIAPKLSSLVLIPAISNNFIESPGVITVGGQLTMEGTIRLTPPPTSSDWITIHATPLVNYAIIFAQYLLRHRIHTNTDMGKPQDVFILNEAWSTQPRPWSKSVRDSQR